MARGQNIVSKVFNKPLLITPEELKPISDYLSNPERASGLSFESEKEDTLSLEDFSSESLYKRYVLESLGINPDTMTSVLNIEGVLVNRSGQINASCTELTSYQKLKSTFLSQVEQGIKSCVLMVSSGGGEAFAAWSTANYVRKVADENGVKLFAYVNGSSCSAAYVWTCIADEVVTHPMSQIGSIGVVIQLYNDSERMKQEGYQRTFICAGENKIPFDNEGNFTNKFISDLQKSVDKTYDKFVNHVAEHRSSRGLTKEAIIRTQASIFDAEEALELGLADKIMELEDFEIEYGLKAPKMKNTSFTSMATNSDSSQQPIADGNLTKEGIMSKQIDAQEAPKTDELLSDAHATNTEAGSPEMKNDLTAKLSVLEKENTELSTQLSELNKQLQSYESQVEELTSLVEKKELAYRTAQRQAKLEDALGKDNDKVLELVKTTESLSDEQFEIIAQSLAGSQVAKQEELKEFGGEGQEANVQLSLAEQIKKTAETMNRKA